MKHLQKFLDLIFPHQYLIVDDWDEMDSEYDVYGIYRIPQHQRALGWEESKRILKSYSPEFVILKSDRDWYFQYTKTYEQTQSEPGGSFYVEFRESFASTESTLVALVKWIIEDMSKDFFLNEKC